MSGLADFNRRDFLKLVGLGTAGAASGCASRPAEKLIPWLVPPADVLPGVPVWYASTCQECSAACGILVKAREGRVVKIEGNPAHPLSRGATCARGQAALQGLYDPDRVRTPLVRQGGVLQPATWDAALKTVSDAIARARGGNRVALLTGHRTGSLARLAGQWAAAAGGTHLAWEPFGDEPARAVHGDRLPALDFTKARMVLSFGADFLHTFGLPVSQARDFAAMRSQPDRGRFVAVEPRLSATGSTADEWIAVKPGAEAAVALAMLNVIGREGLGAAPMSAVSGMTPEAVAGQTGVPADVIVRVAREFARSRPSLAIAGGVSAQSEQATTLAAAVQLLNEAVGNVGTTVLPGRGLDMTGAARFADLQALIQSMAQGQVQVLLVHDANPIYAVPDWAGFTAAMGKVPLKVSLSGVLDETAQQCDVVLPSLHSLESWGDAEPVAGVASIQQPTMAPLPMFDARATGDTLIALAKGAGLAGITAPTWLDHLKTQWAGRGGAGQAAWEALVQKGGTFAGAATGGGAGGGGGAAAIVGHALGAAAAGAAVAGANTGANAAPAGAAAQLRGSGDFGLVLYASPALHDGRGANKSWLQELPDPVTSATWGSWVEMHPDVAKRLGIETGELVTVTTDAGHVVAPAYVTTGIRNDTLAIPLGQGHTALGRYAKGRGARALALLPNAMDTASGAPAYVSARARIAKAAGVPGIALAQPEKFQGSRAVAQIVPVAALLGSGPVVQETEERYVPGPEMERAASRPGTATEPRANETLPPHAIHPSPPSEPGRTERQIYVTEGSYSNPNHRHRWAMAIDTNVCNGCGACVVACNAENNVPTVGPDMVMRGRHMSWLRIERYEEKLAPGATDVRFLPMLCQQCTDAPCEPVCPVYATYHNPEGLNAQVYNRCVGTRYCSNNCPYKVRSFNWFDYAAPEKATYAFPEPLNWQLNPDVTVRSKGVMEKCTFCVQRILEQKGLARDENRPLRDGEIQTACQQACPSEAIVFGDLMDPRSQVARRSNQGPRRYWALQDLNTKPGITYLKKFDRGGGAA